MKKLLTLLFALAIVSTATAQRNDLKGPNAKNYKYHKNSKNGVTPVTTSKNKVKGPKAKNQKIWKVEEAFETNKVEVVAYRQGLKGPKAKNLKPWDKVQAREPKNTITD